MLGCGKTFVNGEPYYIAQMDTPGVIAGEPGFDRLNVGKPEEVKINVPQPFWKEITMRLVISFEKHSYSLLA